MVLLLLLRGRSKVGGQVVAQLRHEIVLVGEDGAAVRGGVQNHARHAEAASEFQDGSLGVQHGDCWWLLLR